jgi:hypothetical protein
MYQWDNELDWRKETEKNEIEESKVQEPLEAAENYLNSETRK